MRSIGQSLFTGLRRMSEPRAESSRLRGVRLRESDLFQDLDDRQMAEVAERLPMATCPAGRLIYEPGETGEALFILKKGTVRLYRMTVDGRKLVLAVLGAGSIFGDMSALGQSMTGSFAEATEDCVVCILSRTDIEFILQEHPGVALRMVQLFATRLREAEDRLEQVAFQSVPARVARLLLQLANDDGEIGDYSHNDLAEIVGTSRETVSRALVQLKRQGYVAIDRRSVRVLDRVALEALATGNE